ncbi:MAG: DUF3501 family protein [Gammaproteobacteria bacterium]
MKKIDRNELYSLERYAQLRKEFRARVMAHKRDRRLAIGANVTLCFEDRLTIQYQIQEMLRVERIFEAEGIEQELAAYNPLIPDGRNWKATMMIEYDDPEERASRLAGLIGVENSVWMRIDGMEDVQPIADEDLDRVTDEKTSAVHFLRFELTDEMAAALKAGASLAAGIDHQAYRHSVDPVAASVRESLIGDLD